MERETAEREEIRARVRTIYSELEARSGGSHEAAGRLKALEENLDRWEEEQEARGSVHR